MCHFHLILFYSIFIFILNLLEKGLLTAEAVTLARQIVNKEKTTSDLIDEGFSREGFRDKEGLPAW